MPPGELLQKYGEKIRRNGSIDFGWAAAGPGPLAGVDRPRFAMTALRLMTWRTARRGTQIGVADIMLFDMLTIPDITVHAREGQYWAELPGRLRWRSPVVADRFNKSLIALIRLHCPEAFDGSSPLLHGQLLARLSGKS
jgi:hypothetical protein